MVNLTIMKNLLSLCLLISTFYTGVSLAQQADEQQAPDLLEEAISEPQKEENKLGPRSTGKKIKTTNIEMEQQQPDPLVTEVEQSKTKNKKDPETKNIELDEQVTPDPLLDSFNKN